MARESQELLVKSKSAADAAAPRYAPIQRAGVPGSILGRFLKFTPSRLPRLGEVGRRLGQVLERRPSGYLLSLITLVVIPSIMAVFYLAFIASDQYAAEARFAVRSIQSESGSEDLLSSLTKLGSASGGAGMMP